MTEGSEKVMDMEIKGISCDVKNCKYHDKANNCNAGHIKVGNSNATSSTDTKCETFECGDGCSCR
mgnify:FL=1